MEAGLEHFDLGLVNYRQHPTNVNYVVYRFKDLNRANTFEMLLKENGIWYERSDPEEDEKPIVMFAVEKKFFNKTQELNFLTEAKHRTKLIPHKGFRLIFVLIMISILSLGLMGYCQSRKTLEEANKQMQTSQMFDALPNHQ
jgi:hypothetical protein